MVRHILILAVSIGPASAAPLVITAGECAHIIEHHPAPDIAYVAGRDAEGRAVTPADLDGGVALRMPSEIEIPIKLDLNRCLGPPSGPESFDAEAMIGVVGYRDGAMTFNGQALHSEAEAALIRACREHARKQAKTEGAADSP